MDSPAFTPALGAVHQYSLFFLLLMLYSFLGWCGEMVYCSLGQRRLCEKRGFLNGPVCPIYGHGALVVLLCLHGGCKNPLLTFLLGAVLTSLVEYITSFAMEKLFHMRWWDYSQYKFHLNGRICLLNSTLFGLASVFLCHFANPPISAWLAGLLASGAAVPLSLILLAVYLTDIVLSVRGAIQLGGRLARLHAIYGELSEKLESMTAEARQTVHTKLEERGGELTARLEAVRQEAQQKLRTLYDRQSLFERRLLRSFPTMRSIHYPEAMKKWKEYLEFRKK